MIVAIDFDGTIADINSRKAEWIRENLGINLPSWKCNYTDCLPLIGKNHYAAMAELVYNRENTMNTPQVPGAREALQILAEKARLFVVTARTPERAEFAREWLEQHAMLEWFEQIHSSKGASKFEVCERICASVLIDDDPRHLRSTTPPTPCPDLRILLQVGRNEPYTGDSGITLCNSWGQVPELAFTLR